MVKSTCCYKNNKRLAPRTHKATYNCLQIQFQVSLPALLEGSVLQFLLFLIHPRLMGHIYVCSPASIENWTNTWLAIPTCEPSSPASSPPNFICTHLGPPFLVPQMDYCENSSCVSCPLESSSSPITMLSRKQARLKHDEKRSLNKRK